MDDTNKAPLQSEQNNEVTVDSVEPSEKLTPEHPRFQQVNQQKKEALEALEREREEKAELQRQLEELKANSQNNSEDDFASDEERIAADAIERKILKRKGYVTKEDLAEIRRVENRASEYRRLSEKYNGSNGLPRFVPEDVQLFASRNGYGDNYEAAYKELHHDARVQLEAKRLATPNIPSSEKPTGGEQVIEGGISLEKAKSDPAYYEEHRDVILADMKRRAKLADNSPR